MTASLRAALSGADLLGFSTRRGDAQSAKAAFVGVPSAPKFGYVRSGGQGGGNYFYSPAGRVGYAGGAGGSQGGPGGNYGGQGGGAGGFAVGPGGSSRVGGYAGGAGSGVGAGMGGAGGQNGVFVNANGAVGAATASNGVAGTAGSNAGYGGGGGGGGVGVIGAYDSPLTLTLTGAVTGGNGGDGGAAGQNAGSYAGGSGGYGGAGVLLSSGSVTVATNGAVQGGRGGGGRYSGGGGYGVLFASGAPSTLNVMAGGRVSGGDALTSAAGGRGVSGQDYLSVDNAGGIAGGRGVYGGVGVHGGGYVTITNRTAGTIGGGAGSINGARGVAVEDYATITNSGAIVGGAGTSGMGGTGVYARGDTTLTNSGAITGGDSGGGSASRYAGAGVLLRVGSNTVTNSGSITGGAGSQYGAFIGSDATITNTGSIRGGAAAGAPTGASLGVALGVSNATIVNSGVIAGGAGTGSTTGYALIALGDTLLTLSATNGGVTTAGTITGAIGFGSTLSIDPGPASSVTLSNVLANSPPPYVGAGALTKIGANTLVLTGASTYTGATTVSAGVLEIGQGGSLTSAITVNAGTLRGVGSTMGAVSVASGATFAPGNAAGTGAFTIGSATVNGAASLSLPSGAIFAETLTSAAAYGMANVSGQVTLGGALNLTIAPGAVLPVGTVFTLIHETGVVTPLGGPVPGLTTTNYPMVSGTFAGQAEGSLITAGGYTFTVSYLGGTSGRDTTLTETAAPNTAPTVAGTHASSTSDRASDPLFSGVTVVDPDAGQTETATISFASANGVLNGAGAATLANGVSTYTVQAGSATALTTALQAVTFQPTQAPLNTPPTTTTVTLSVSDGQASSGADTHTVVMATHAVNTPPTVTNATPTQTTTDKAAVQPFSGVTVTDPDAAQTETATIAYAAANGVLAGAGLSGTAGNYTVSAGSATELQSALRALQFTPTQNQVAPNRTVTTTFTVTVSDGAAQNQATDMVTVTSVNDPAVFGNFQTTATQTPATPVLLQTQGLTVTDPDPGAMVSSAFVSVVSGGVAGDVLAVQGALPAGITAAYDAANYVLTLSSTTPLADGTYAQALRQVTFVHQGPTDTSTRTVAFNVNDDQGMRTRSVNETVSVGAVSTFVPPTTPTQTPSQAAGYMTQGDNLVRVAPTDPALSDPTNPVARQVAAEQAIAQRLDTGQISAQDAQSLLFHLVDGTTSVAEISYAFFTGKTPTAAGLNFLVHSAANPTDLNDAYYQQFTTENRYINFAANLATGQGAGAAAFQAAYGSLSLQDATAKAYQAVFGITPTADKITAILNEQVNNGRGGTETRAQYLADITGGSAIAQKAAAVGFLLADSVKEGFGTYQQADLHFLQDLAHGTAAFNVDLLAAYGQAPSLVGQPVLDPTLGS